MGPSFSFPQQFFAVSSPIPGSRVLLAGGLYPLSGSRSAYRASVACYDYAAGRVVWLNEKTMSYPFRAIAHTSDVCAAMLDQNFVRCPKGLFRFDLASGEPIPPDCEVSGWKIDFVDATADAFLFSWVCDEVSRVRAVHGRDATFQEMSFPYHSTSAGKTIERVIATEGKKFAAVFSLVKGSRVVFSVEQWGLDSAAPDWQHRTSLRHVVRNDSVLLLWGGSRPRLWGALRPRLDVEILASASGQVQTSFRLPLADVVAIQPIDVNSYAVLTITGVYILDATSQAVTQVVALGPDDFLDFGGLAFDSSSGKLIVVTAGNHQRPETHLTVLDL